ncbi:MAG: hypothetical protein UR34_C0002G0077 [candidate division WS6 bacterium GW2011_GWC1_33_20]|uniref:Uncharacterized protein n=2 Tax=Candidatus Dojkabacteria TaxID=74243 RepID=A0A0G0DH66_9BACT|nr:MAG: hypothetical protein UR32_C0005G0003 [candidate division WS6 bacterium GW2011_GWE2_33_157]KKP44574.1 MAG: hypothetical protein UR34_C0002G0077 [candidate division WS6 bacterium GW2011_GWC1_33_20]KKP46116.1 MAG: hypothetical protein UR36_C0001G0008 [candidate division WS6 bacterium GW2011_GWF1_33_233]KKP54188.1 MAG: hypothetical protein UR45_C0023G0004 [candidate division WS6 bacterium GW2011_WS6_33_547]KKP54672.1 MAG: hypothetical protein UR47_C0013G0052 [candidate division WS6 bacteriu
MKISVNKKVLLVVIIFLLLVFLILILLPKNKYPKEPLVMRNLGNSTKEVDISSLLLQEQDIKILFVEPKVHISLVEEMINTMGLDLDRRDIKENSLIKWSGGGNEFTYDAITDSVSFNLTKEVNLLPGIEGFSQIFNQYLGIDYEFILEREEINTDEEHTYFASRVNDELPIQYGQYFGYSDKLSFDKEERLISGELLLAEITEYDMYIPTIKKSDLTKYINIESYPKEHYVDTSVLADTLDLYYLDDAWEEIENSITNCKASQSELILLYKNSEQGYLLPVFKILSNCDVEYKSDMYSVPTTFYVNAVDTDYIANE